SCAPGSIVRTDIPSDVLCIPRNENGSLWRASTTAAICGSGRSSTLSPLHPRQDAEDAFQRNIDPAGPVRQLVGDFVDRLLECKERHNPAPLALARRVGVATTHRLT